ncbi:MAG: DUF262 domain-containing protein, partial [Nitrospira sp.]
MRHLLTAQFPIYSRGDRMDSPIEVETEDGRVSSMSVADIVAMWTGRRDDPWKLALVQRDLVWDEYRMARLLDSLIRDYPIGTILLCKTQEKTKVLVRESNVRKAMSDEGAWQLLDGQQRTFAMAAIFSSRKPEIGRFYLHMSSAPLPELEVKGKDRRIHEYIRWQTTVETPDIQGSSRSAWDRKFWLDLAKFGDWLLDGHDCPGGDTLVQCSPENWREWLKTIDAEFDGILPGKEEEFLNRSKALVRAWNTKIPVQRVELESADEVLQVFSRLNLEGVRTSAADIFFAGVKTLWPDAEESLQRTAEKAKVLDRFAALRLVARVASYNRNEQDIIPLDLKRLKGREGEEIVRGMQDLVSSEEKQGRLEVLGRELKKILGYALHFVDPHLMDHVFCWAMENKDLERFDLAEAVDYLFGGTAFRLYPVFGDGFSRKAFKLCFANGRESREFPLAQTLEMLKNEWPSLSYSRSRIPHALTIEDKRSIVGERPHLFLSLVQNLPYALPKGRQLDWDHIYAQSLAHRMKWKGPNAQWKSQYHEDCSYVWKAGNLCALDSILNQQLQDNRPTKKLPFLKEKLQAGELWPPDLFLSDEERHMLLEADELIEERNINDGMTSFKRYVESRQDRIWQEALPRFPKLQVFLDLLVPSS